MNPCRHLLVGGLVLVLAGCGTSASITGLRCDSPCQDPEDPFLLHLEADYSDPARELTGGQLIVKIDGTDQATYLLDGLLPKGGASLGVISFELPLHFARVTQGQTFTVGVRARHGELETDESVLEFAIHL